MDSLLGSAFLTGFGCLVNELGGEPSALLSMSGIDQDIESRPKDFVAFKQFVHLLESAAIELGCPDFGLRLSNRQGLAVLGPLAVLASNQTTVAKAFQAISRYMHLQIPAMNIQLETTAQQGQIRILVSVVGSSPNPLPQFLEFIVGNGQKITHLLAGAAMPAQQIYFPHQPRSTHAVYRRFFGCPVYFSSTFCAVDLPEDVIGRTIEHADPATAELAAEYLASQAPATNFGANIVQLINHLLATGHCSIQVVARQLNLHPRTLQRRLASQNLIFEEMLDAERRLLARRYLAEPGLQLAQVSGLLGYTEQSALNRSCRRWFNTTPTQMRKNLQDHVRS